MNDCLSEIPSDLRRTLDLYGQMLRVVETENQALRQPEPPSLFEGFTARKQLLPRLEESLTRLRVHRATWTDLAPEERRRHPEIGGLLRQCQDLIMKVLLLDRENEQALLRQGLLGPRHLPSHNARRPGFVANLYRNQAAG